MINLNELLEVVDYYNNKVDDYLVSFEVNRQYQETYTKGVVDYRVFTMVEISLMDCKTYEHYSFGFDVEDETFYNKILNVLSSHYFRKHNLIEQLKKAGF